MYALHEIMNSIKMVKILPLFCIVDGLPSLEVHLDSFTALGGTLRVLARNVEQTSGFEATLPFNVSIE